MRRIVLDMQSELFADAVTKVLTDSNLDFGVYRTSKPEETISLCRARSRSPVLKRQTRGWAGRSGKRLSPALPAYKRRTTARERSTP